MQDKYYSRKYGGCRLICYNRDPLVILEEMAEMVKMEISVIPVTLDPLGQVEIRAPREYKDHLETLDLLAPR